MKNALISILVLLLLGTAGYFLIGRTGSSTTVNLDTPKNETITSAWIEIQSGQVLLQKIGQSEELINGDLVYAGEKIATGRNAKAIIHMPDGSLLRLDENTTVTLSALSLDTSDHTLVVQIGLSVGRVWSKVIGLATPKSTWEVKTANTVATVRGTAFGMGFKNGETWMLGSEHTVAVAALNPDTKEKIEKSEVLVEAGKLIILNDTLASLASATSSTTTLQQNISTPSKSFMSDKWIDSSRNADKQYDNIVQKIKSSTASDEAVREELRKNDEESWSKVTGKKVELRTNEKELPSSSSKNTSSESSQEIPKNEPAKSPTTELPNSRSTISSPGAVNTDIRGATVFTIKADHDARSLTEGDKVQFKLYITTIDSDGKSRTEPADLTSRFGVVGGIGDITPGGLFTAKLASNVSEYGEAVGYVISLLGDTPNDPVAKSDLITVHMKIDLTKPEDIGGQ